MRSVKRGRSSLFPFFFGCITDIVARMDHAYLPIRCPEINEDRIFVKRQIVFPSERFADCLRSQQDSRVGRYRTFVSGILPQMIDYLEETFKNKKRIKNGQIVDSTTNAKRYVYLKRELQAFTKEKYEKAFSSYFFTDITEEFLLDFAFWLKERGIRNGNKAGLTHKLRLLRAVCRQAEKKEMYGVNMDNFLCLGDDINWPETTSRAVPETVIAKIANVDRTLFTKKEQLHLDLFLFSYYTGGMANVDVCNLTWDLVQEDRIVYERIKFPKTAKPELLSKAKAIMNKYRGQSYGNYVFPVFTHKHTTTSKKTTRVKQISTRLSQTLTKACKMLRIKENITWYSARGSFISKMVDAGNNPYVVAEMAGNSPLTIYKHYYKNTKREEIKRQMEEMF